MIRFTLSCFALLSLTGCHILNPEDPRLGEEALEACIARVGDPAVDRNGIQFVSEDQTVLPTFTYDVTKVSPYDLRELIVPGSDETAGSRGMTSTNETSTAVAMFMEQPVDENGAFFFGRDPALYRVRGEAVAFDQAVTAGCERQVAGMRLLSTTLKFTIEDDETDGADQSDQSEDETPEGL